MSFSTNVMAVIRRDIEPCCLLEGKSAKEALAIINSNEEKIAIIVKESGKICGTITDGDIRRALLEGKDLEESVNVVMNRNPYIENEKSTGELINSKMIEHGLSRIPLVDDKMRAKKLAILSEDFNRAKRENPVLIMAGGKGKRLHPLTLDCPKPMIEVNGRPMLEIVINNFIDCGFKNFYISVNYLKEKIIEYFGDGSKFGINIRYVTESEPLGTAGALSLMRQFDIKMPLIVINGDVLTRLNAGQLLEYHNSNGAKATMCVRKHSITIPYGVVESNGSFLKNIREKPDIPYMANAGVYVIGHTALDILKPEKYMDMPDLLQKIANVGGRVAVFPIHEYWLDVGRHETLREAVVTWDNEAD